jgi:hypothetical protein
MAKKVKPLDVKVKVTGPLANLMGKTSVKRKDILKNLWHGKNGVHKLGLQGGEGDTVKVGKKTYKGGQVIFCGENPDWKKMCGGKKKISMTQVLKYAYKYVE